MIIAVGCLPACLLDHTTYPLVSKICTECDKEGHKDNQDLDTIRVINDTVAIIVIDVEVEPVDNDNQDQSGKYCWYLCLGNSRPMDAPQTI